MNYFCPTMKNLRLFPKHTGVWEGTYRRISPEGALLDQWNSRLSIRISPDGSYRQVNEYFWPDGHYECHDFGVCFFNEEGTLIFDTPRIKGHSWETRDSVCLIWEYLDRPGSKLYEMIDLIGPEEKHRIRVWKWSYFDTFEGLTMIEERNTASQEDIPEDFWAEASAKRFKGVSRSNR
ncbi:MAG: hypothetical protein RL386_1443 [Bacteroidota bacterium]